MKKLIWLILLISCSEEITEIVPAKNKDGYYVGFSSNNDVKITVYNSNFLKTFYHYPNERQETKVFLPIGDYYYYSDCGSGFIDKQQIYLLCP